MNLFFLGINKERSQPFFIILIWLVFAVIYVPIEPYMPAAGLDPSWLMGISYALKNKLAFGNDVVFTYGPLGAAFHPGPWPGLFEYAVVFWLIMTFMFSLSAFLWAKKVGPIGLICLLPAVFIGGLDAVILVILFVITRVVFYKDISWEYKLFVAFVLSVLSVSKFTFLVSSSVLIMFVALDMVREKKSLKAMAVLLVFSLSFAVIWVFLGQNINQIPSFINNGIQISSGYPAAMGVDGGSKELLVAIALLLMLIYLAILGRLKHMDFNNISLSYLGDILGAAASILIGFVAFKQGMVRQDAHVLCFVAFAATAIPMLLYENSSVGTRSIYHVFGFLVLWSMFYVHADRNHGGGKDVGVIKANLMHVAGKIKGAINGLYDFNNKFEAAFKAIREATPVPQFKGSVDVASYDISPILASNLDWRPRPVIQSYSAYTPKLATLNGEFVESAGADYYLVKLQAIDGHFPLLEDPLLWQAILKNYRLGDLTNFLVYKRSPQAKEYISNSVVLKKVGSEWVVPVSAKNGYALLNMNVKKDLLSYFRSFLIRPSEVNMIVNIDDGSQRKFKYIESLDGVDFIISPLVENDVDFALLSCLCERDGKRVTSLSLEDGKGREVYLDKPPTLTVVEFDKKEEGFSEAVSAKLGRSVFRVIKSTADAIKNPLLMVDGRLVVNGHSNTEIKFYPTRNKFNLCYGVRVGAIDQPEFDGIRFVVKREGKELVNDVFNENSSYSSRCKEIDLNGKSQDEFTLITDSNGNASYDWGYWYED
jgi:hypothetical protein